MDLNDNIRGCFDKKRKLPVDKLRTVSSKIMRSNYGSSK